MNSPQCPSVAIVTTARDRRDHLARQREWIRRHAPGVEHVIIDMGGETIDPGLDTVVTMDLANGSALPLSAARNLGAGSTAADVLVFLDVDCLPTPELVPVYARRIQRHGGVWAGPVGYLPPTTDIEDWSSGSLARVARFHAGRPWPGQSPRPAPSPDMFWSLSFAIAHDDFDEVGGFDERYQGYGGEDTDFARMLERDKIPIVYDGDALAFHQHHSVSTPPVEHLDDIVANAARFHDKWGEWPMRGWLAAFRDAGLIAWDPDGDHIVVGARR